MSKSVKVFLVLLVGFLIGVVVAGAFYSVYGDRFQTARPLDDSVNQEAQDVLQNEKDQDLVSTPSSGSLEDESKDVSDSSVGTDTKVSENSTSQPDQAENLDIEWLGQAKKLNVSEFHFFVKSDEWLTVDKAFQVYQVGVVKSEFFQESRLLLVERWLGGPGGAFHYRVVDDQKNKKLIVLSHVSNPFVDEDAGNFAVSDAYDIADLHFPETLNMSVSSKDFVLEAETFSPAVLFDDYFKDLKERERDVREIAVHPTYGKVFENVKDGYFIVKLPDHTVKLYRLQFPFPTTVRPDLGWVTLVSDFSFVIQGEETPSFSGTYTPVSIFPCPPRMYRVHSGIDARLKKNGIFVPFKDAMESLSGSTDMIPMDYYEPVDTQDEFYKQAYNSSYQYYPQASQQKIAYEDFVRDHPLVFWKDAMGRWVQLSSIKYQSPVETECQYYNSIL